MNGFFLLPIRALHDVNGFNEFITSYGWDDDDIYERLIMAGYVRQDVAPGTVFHLDHSDAERTGMTYSAAEKQESTLEQLTRRTSVSIEINRVLVGLMPYWDRSQVLLPVEIFGALGKVTLLRRKREIASDVPVHLLAAARYQVLTDHLALRFGQRVRELPAQVIDRLLARPAADLSHLDVAVGSTEPTAVIDGVGQYIVIDIQHQSHYGSREVSRAIELVLADCAQRSLRPVIRSAGEKLSTEAETAIRGIPVVPMSEIIGLLHECTCWDLRSAPVLPSGNLLIRLEDALIAASDQGQWRKVPNAIE